MEQQQQATTTLPTGFSIEALRAGSVKVVGGTAASVLIGGLAGSTIGVVRNQPAIPLAFTSSLNTGLFAFTFFSIREYAVHPTLTLLLPPSTHSAHFSRADSPHTVHLLSTFIAAFPAGSLFSITARRSAAGATKAGFTLAVGCTVLQSAWNESALIRLKALKWGEERKEALDAAARDVSIEEKVPPPTFTRPITSPTPSVPARESFSERSDRLFGEAFAWGRGKLESWSPVKKIDRKDYESVLETKLVNVREEKERVEKEVRELENRRLV